MMNDTNKKHIQQKTNTGSRNVGLIKRICCATDESISLHISLKMSSALAARGADGFIYKSGPEILFLCAFSKKGNA